MKIARSEVRAVRRMTKHVPAKSAFEQSQYLEQNKNKPRPGFVRKFTNLPINFDWFHFLSIQKTNYTGFTFLAFRKRITHLISHAAGFSINTDIVNKHNKAYVADSDLKMTYASSP
ncbi:hypothetical protein TNCV_279321 [Trichonephila clavipes]|nr:hypothetical protein TNCV_279321 [Trichonephila clavipes]